METLYASQEEEPGLTPNLQEGCEGQEENDKKPSISEIRNRPTRTSIYDLDCQKINPIEI